MNRARSSSGCSRASRHPLARPEGERRLAQQVVVAVARESTLRAAAPVGTQSLASDLSEPLDMRISQSLANGSAPETLTNCVTHRSTSNNSSTFGGDVGVAVAIATIFKSNARLSRSPSAAGGKSLSPPRFKSKARRPTSSAKRLPSLPSLIKSQTRRSRSPSSAKTGRRHRRRRPRGCRCRSPFRRRCGSSRTRGARSRRPRVNSTNALQRALPGREHAPRSRS